MARRAKCHTHWVFVCVPALLFSRALVGADSDPTSSAVNAAAETLISADGEHRKPNALEEVVVQGQRATDDLAREAQREAPNNAIALHLPIVGIIRRSFKSGSHDAGEDREHIAVDCEEWRSWRLHPKSSRG